MRVLIAGGGIGGLTAALCCLHFGHDVMVFEQASEFGEVGAGIQIPPNAMKVFQALGIDGQIASAAFRPETIEARMGESGRYLFTIPLSHQAVERWGAPYLHIHRADYIAALESALRARAPKAIHLGVGVKRYRNHSDGVLVTLENGQQFEGDVLIGADGLKSVIRTAMLGPEKPSFTGNIAWRAVVPISALGEYAPNPTACVWMGRGRHAVTYHLRGGSLVNFVGVVENDAGAHEGWSEKGRQEAALKDFAGWHPVITHLIQSAAPDAFYRWALYDRAPLDKWTDGNTALLGDAAHPMLPFLAQGAAMAVEDAWVLAREISQTGRPASKSLMAYQASRLGRTAKTQAGSRANMRTFHRRTKLGKFATYGPMWLSGKLAPSAVHRRMDWLYGHDVTQG